MMELILKVLIRERTWSCPNLIRKHLRTYKFSNEISPKIITVIDYYTGRLRYKSKILPEAGEGSSWNSSVEMTRSLCNKLEREKQIIARNIYKNNDTTIFNRKLLLNLGLEKQSCVSKQGIREKTRRKLQVHRKRGISSGAKVSFIKSVRDRKSTVDQTDFMMKRAVRGVDIPEKKTASKISLKYLKNLKYGKSPKRTFRLIKLGCK